MKKNIFTVAILLCASFVFSSVASAVVVVPPPAQFPTTKDQCKKGGWQDFGGLFKNQGDCVSFVATDGKNQPDGAVSEN